jgi:TatD DNase family protein
MDARVKPTDLPDLGAPVPDTHAHLDMLDDPAGVLERAAMAHVGLVVTVVDATEAPEGTFDMLSAWRDDATQRLTDWAVRGAEAPEVRILLGTHPHNAKEYTPSIEALILERGADERVCGIGEIGLDYHYDYSPSTDQRLAFRAQLALAKKLDVPVVVHLREAHAEGLAILAEDGLPPRGCVLHCFTEGPEIAEQFLALGCHISFAGPVTFPKGDAIRDAVRVVPLDRLLVETDATFLAPVPYRGKTNESAWVTLTAAAVGEAKGVSGEEIARAAMDNARRLFARR